MSLVQDPSSALAANVKAASTAPIATDQALVVSISPNTDALSVTLPADTSPSTQNITAQDTGSTTTAGANGQNLVTGTASPGSVAQFTFASEDSVKVQVTGTWTGTLTLEISVDGENTWTACDMHQTGISYTANTFTSNFIGGLNVSGCTNFRVRATTVWTGTATVKVVLTTNTNSVYVTNPQNIRDGVTQSILNTIKAASTAATAADTAIVMALSPNGPLPVGTNTIGGVIAVDSLTGVSGNVQTTNGIAEQTFVDTRALRQRDDLLTAVQTLIDRLNNDALTVQGMANGIPVSVPTSGNANAPQQQTVGTAVIQIVGNTGPGRVEVMVVNTGTTKMYLGLGVGPTTTAYHVALAACTAANDGTGGSFVSDVWKGAIYAVSSAASGTLVATEMR